MFYATCFTPIKLHAYNYGLTVLLPRGAMRKRGLRCRAEPVRPSVRPSVSVTFVYFIQTAKAIVMVHSLCDSPSS